MSTIGPEDRYPLCKHLPKDIIKKMSDELNESNKDGREHGFFICSNTKAIQDINDKNTVSSEKTIGTEYSVFEKMEKESKCPESLKKMGMFHTHPPVTNKQLKEYSIKNYGIDLEEKILTNLSRGDVWYSTHKDFEFACVGAKDGIKCFSMNPFKGKIPEDFNEYNLQQKREWRKAQGTIQKPKYREKIIRFDDWSARELEKHTPFCEIKI